MESGGLPYRNWRTTNRQSRLGSALKVNMNSKLEIDKVSHNNKGELH